MRTQEHRAGRSAGVWPWYVACCTNTIMYRYVYCKIRSIQPPPPPCTLHSFQVGGLGVYSKFVQKNLEYTRIHRFCVRIELQHKPLSTRQWYKLRGGRIQHYKSQHCKTLPLKRGWVLDQGGLILRILQHRYIVRARLFTSTCTYTGVKR